MNPLPHLTRTTYATRPSGWTRWRILSGIDGKVLGEGTARTAEMARRDARDWRKKNLARLHQMLCPIPIAESSLFKVVR